MNKIHKFETTCFVRIYLAKGKKALEEPRHRPSVILSALIMTPVFTKYIEKNESLL